MREINRSARYRTSRVVGLPFLIIVMSLLAIGCTSAAAAKPVASSQIDLPTMSPATPTPAQQFLELLFGKLPEFFKSEKELRELWCAPAARADLLRRLHEKGFGPDQ